MVIIDDLDAGQTGLMDDTSIQVAMTDDQVTQMIDQLSQLNDGVYWIVGLLATMIGLLTAYGFWIGKIGGRD